MAADRVQQGPAGDEAWPVSDADLAPASTFFAVTPHNSTNFTTNARSLWIGAAGDVSVVAPDGTAVTFAAVPAGTLLPVRAKRVNSTGTTASSIVGLV